MNREKLTACIEAISPSELAESWDNCGIQIQTDCGDVGRVLVALEITHEVIDEAIEAGADLILTHHPLLFSDVRSIRCTDVTGQYIQRLIGAGISVYACHTSFDRVDGGNNDYVGQLLDLEDVQPFSDGNPFCRKGRTAFASTFLEIVHQAAEAFGIDTRHFRYVGNLAQPIDTVGWCTGAGGDFFREAAREGCDLFITGDLKYHEAQEARALGLCVLDAGHYGTEKIFVENMAARLREACRGEEIEILGSTRDLNPFA